MNKYKIINTFASLLFATLVAGSFCLARAEIEVQDLVVLDAKEKVGAGYAAQSSIDIEELIVLSGEDVTTDEIFGPDYGNFHAWVTVEPGYTDNVYNIDSEAQTDSSFVTLISANMWLINYKANRLPVQISSYNTAVGGTRFSMPIIGSFDRFQTYLRGGVDFELYSVDSALDNISGNLEGMFQYKMPAGISFRIIDKFIYNRDRIEVGSFDSATYDEADQQVIVSQNARFRYFYSNQAKGFLNVDVSERLAGLLSYTNFYLDYEDERDDWLDRMDHRYSLHLKYNHSPKTSLFLQGEYAESDYDTATYNNSNDIYLYGGVNLHRSIKSQFMIKAGYQIKNFDNKDELDNTNTGDHIDTGQEEDVESFVYEAWMNYRYSDKTKFSFKLARGIEATDTALSLGKDTTSSRIYCDYEFTERIRIYLDARLEVYDYEGYYLAGEQRDDLLWGLTPALQYDFRKWLMAQISYTYEDRDSNIDIYDFTTQFVTFSINGSF